MNDWSGFWKFLEARNQWSEQTFGTGDRTNGLCAHIRKECAEVEAAGGNDLSEWIDIILLALDGAHRCADANPTQTILALCAKQEKNVNRRWPSLFEQDPNAAVEHIK